MSERDERGRFRSKYDVPEWMVDCALSIDVRTGRNDEAEVERINALYRQMRLARGLPVAGL